MPRELRFPGEGDQDSPNLGEELVEKIASTPSPELVELRDTITQRISEGAVYSGQELAQVQQEFGGMFNTGTPELARNTLFINEVLQLRLITQELEKRKVG